MKRFLGSLVCLMLFAATLPADVLIDEQFSYTDGALTTVGAPFWTTHSGTAGQIQVSGGAISLNDADSEDVNRQLASAITSGQIFAGFDFSVTAAAPASGDDYEYFASFGNGTTDFTSRVDVVNPSMTGDFTLGIAGAGSTADATFGSDLTFGTTYRAVIRYDRDSGISTLWVSPTSAASASIDSLADTNDVSGFYFRQSNSSVNETIGIDNLIVATTFDEAAGLSVIPEPGSLAVLSLFGLAGLVRRRK